MQNKGLLSITLVLVVIFGALHFAASAFYLYWSVWWFDSLMHLLGGLCLGLFFVWLGGRLGSWSSLVVLALVMAIGVAWEVFEYAYGITGVVQGSYALDLVLDLVADFLGVLAALAIGKKWNG